MIFWICFFIFWIILATGAVAGISAAPWVPTRQYEIKLLLKELEIKSGDTIYDLGCGTGTILISLAEKHKNANFIGCEISILPYTIAKIRTLRLKNVKIKYKNLFNQEIQDADFIIAFLLGKAYKRLAQKFKAELKPDAYAIIEGWPIKTIQLHKKIKIEKALPFYIYKGSEFKK